MPLNEAARALENVEVPGARMRVIENETRGLTIIDDCYNAGPNSMRAALETLRDFPQDSKGTGRRVAVLGAMKELGEHADAQHCAIGALAAQCAELVIGVGEETKILLKPPKPSALFRFIPNGAKTRAAPPQKRVIWCAKAIWFQRKGSRSVGLELVVNALRSDE